MKKIEFKIKITGNNVEQIGFIFKPTVTNNQSNNTEFIPKMGDKVLVSQDNEHWSTRVFVYINYNEDIYKYFCIDGKGNGNNNNCISVTGTNTVEILENLIGWKFIKELK